jgi:hypothetical protein
MELQSRNYVRRANRKYNHLNEIFNLSSETSNYELQISSVISLYSPASESKNVKFPIVRVLYTKLALDLHDNSRSDC